MPTQPVLPDLLLGPVTVRPLADAVIDQLGHDPRGDYVERYWLGVLGPSAVWLLRRLVAGLEAQPAGYQVDLATVAVELGLGGRSGRNSPFVRTLQRTERFGMLQHRGDELFVRRRLPPLTRVQQQRLPAHLQLELADAPERDADGRSAGEVLERARGLALTLLADGRDADRAERALHELAVHPAVAHAAVTWAARRPAVVHRIADCDRPTDAA